VVDRPPVFRVRFLNGSVTAPECCPAELPFLGAGGGRQGTGPVPRGGPKALWACFRSATSPGDGRDAAATAVERALRKALAIDGALGVAVVDSRTGQCVGRKDSGSGMDLDVAAAGNTELVLAKRKVVEGLGLDQDIEDILITLGSQYHLLRVLHTAPDLFFYLVLDRGQPGDGPSRARETGAGDPRPLSRRAARQGRHLISGSGGVES
jgi:hypothetical protein